MFGAVVTDLDERGARIQLSDLPIVARLAMPGAEPGELRDRREADWGRSGAPADHVRADRLMDAARGDCCVNGEQVHAEVYT